MAVAKNLIHRVKDVGLERERVEMRIREEAESHTTPFQALRSIVMIEYLKTPEVLVSIDCGCGCPRYRARKPQTANTSYTGFENSITKGNIPDGFPNQRQYSGLKLACCAVELKIC